MSYIKDGAAIPKQALQYFEEEMKYKISKDEFKTIDWVCYANHPAAKHTHKITEDDFPYPKKIGLAKSFNKLMIKLSKGAFFKNYQQAQEIFKECFFDEYHACYEESKELESKTYVLNVHNQIADDKFLEAAETFNKISRKDDNQLDVAALKSFLIYSFYHSNSLGELEFTI